MEGVGEEGSVEDGAPEGEFVGVLNFVAHTHTPRQHSDFHIGVWGELSEDVEIRGVAFHGGTERQNHLTHTAGFHAFFQRVNLNILRSDAIHRRNQSAQHMVEPMMLMRVFDAHHIFHIFHHTNGGAIACRVTANGAPWRFANVVAHFALLYFIAQADNGFAELACALGLLLQQVQHQS